MLRARVLAPFIVVCLLTGACGQPHVRRPAAPGSISSKSHAHISGVHIAAVKQVVYTSTAIESFAVRDSRGKSSGSARWRVVNGASGNDFENELAATANGRLLNWGGAFVRYSDNAGRTWSEVRTVEPLLGAEGAVVGAPNGDVVGVTWDPYTGDRLISMKYTKAGGWQYMEVPMHSPFFDRPWIAVARGPFTIAGQSVPYVTIVRGGYPSKEITYISLDGLNYVLPSSKMLGGFTTPANMHWIALKKDPEVDWMQPHIGSGIAPLAGRGALAGTAELSAPCAWALLTSDLRWSCLRLPSGDDLPSGAILTDSAARIHSVDVSGSVVRYNLSSNGGRTFQEKVATLPADYSGITYDFKVNGKLGLGVVAVHAHSHSQGDDRDFAFKFSTSTGRPVMQKLYYLGIGGKSFGDGVNVQQDDRFDFSSVAILPSGKIAASFVDENHVAAAVAIEL